MGPWRVKNRLHAGPRIGRAAHDLHQCGTPRIDETNPQAARIGVRLRFDGAGTDAILRRRSVVADGLDLETDLGQRRDNLVEGSIGLEMILEPGEGEFHHGPNKAPGVSGTKRVSPAARESRFPFLELSRPRGISVQFEIDQGFRPLRELSRAIATGRFTRGPGAGGAAQTVPAAPPFVHPGACRRWHKGGRAASVEQIPFLRTVPEILPDAPR